MALIKCPECEHEVSDTAITCPNCGYTLKKEITQQKRASFFSKFKVPIIIVLIIGAIAGWYFYDQSTIPKNKIVDFMSDLDFDKSKWELALGSTSSSGYGVYTWENCELVEGITGELTVVDYTSANEMKSWEWELMGDDSTVKAIQRSFAKSFGQPKSETMDDYETVLQYKWVEYSEKNIGDWTLGEDKEKVTVDTFKGDHHSLVLLQKGNQIAVQYIPLNRYEYLWGIKYYSLD